jgi:hypothetical protein
MNVDRDASAPDAGRAPLRATLDFQLIEKEFEMTKRILTVSLLCIALGSHTAFAANDDAGSGDKAQRDQNAAARAADAQCAGAVSVFYLGNSGAAPGGYGYNNPWINCKAPGSAR